MAYLQSGGEWNPGPGPVGQSKPRTLTVSASALQVKRAKIPARSSSVARSEPESVPRQKEVKESKAVTMGARRMIARADQIVAQQLAAETQLAAGGSDAAADKGDEAVQARLLEELNVAVAARSRVREFIAGRILDDMAEVWWHPGHPQGWGRSFCEVSSTSTGITRPPFPHRIAHAAFVRVESTARDEVVAEKIRDVLLVRQSPTTAQQAHAPGSYHEVQFRLVVESFGFGGLPTAQEEFELGFSYEEWCACAQRRVVVPGFMESLERVSAWRAQHQGFPRTDLDPLSADGLNDQLFTALLMRHSKLSTQFIEIGAEMLTKSVCAEVTRRFMKAAPDCPTAAGQYVRGYEVAFSELFPDQWKASADSVRAGVQDADSAAREFLGKVVSDVTTIKRNARVAVDRGWQYCRTLPLSLKGIVPTFPDPFSEGNQLTGMVKRLLSRGGVPDEEGEAREEMVSRGLAEMMSQTCSVFEDLDVSLQCAVEHSVTKGWAAHQIESFVQGARDVAEACREGPEAICAVMRTIRDQLTAVGAFVKQEVYPAAKAKAVRFIAAPEHYVRGATYFLFHGAQKAFFRGMKGHTTKGMTTEEMGVDLTVFAREGEGEATDIWETDYSSFERQMNARRRITMECPILRLCAHPSLRAAIDEMEAIMTGCATFFGGLWSAVTDSMRFSGEYNTSAGNFVGNVCMSFGAISRSLDVRVSDVPKWFQGWSLPWRAEGDDGLFALPKRCSASLPESFRKAGLSIERAVYRAAAEANFCGKRMVELATGGAQLLADPMEILARLTHWVGCNSHTLKFDQEMLVAKAMGYLVQYQGLPLVDPACRAILARYSGTLEALIIGAESASPTPGEAWFRDTVLRKHGGELDRRQLGNLRACLAYAKGIAIETRVAVSQMVEGLTLDVQEKAERMILTHFRTGEGELDVPELRNLYNRAAAVARMTVRTFEGKREEASRHLAELAAAQSVRLGLAWTRAARLISAGMAGVSMVVLAIGTLWLVPVMGAASWSLAAGPVVALTLFSGAVMMQICAILFMVLCLGLSWKVAQRLSSAFWWVMWFSVGYTATSWWRFGVPAGIPTPARVAATVPAAASSAGAALKSFGRKVAAKVLRSVSKHLEKQ